MSEPGRDSREDRVAIEIMVTSAEGREFGRHMLGCSRCNAAVEAVGLPDDLCAEGRRIAGRIIARVDDAEGRAVQ